MPDEPPVSVATYVVDRASCAVGCRLTVDPLVVTDAPTRVPSGPTTAKVVPVTVAGATASLKVALPGAFGSAFVVPSDGATLETAGGVVSGPPPDSVPTVYWRLSQRLYSLLPQFGGGSPQGAES